MQKSIQCYVEVKDGGCYAVCVKCKKKSPLIRGTQAKSRMRAAATLRTVCPDGRTNFYKEMTAADLARKTVSSVGYTLVVAAMIVGGLVAVFWFCIK